MITTCPRCFSFDDVQRPRRLPDGRLEYTCTGEHDGTGAYVWSTASSAVDPPARSTSTGRKAVARTRGTPRTSLVAEDAAVWVSWPKKSSLVATDITEDVIRAVALPLGFVDIKVCAVDETWSGLKLMIRRENRKSKK